MNAPDRLANLRVNPDWAKLPLFDRSKWQRVRFGDVVENLNETCDPNETSIERYIGLEHLEPGSLHIRSWGNVADGTTFTRRAHPGQVLFGKRRAYQRKVAVASFEAVVSGDIYVLAPKGDRMLADLLPFLCMSDRFFNHAVGTSAGSLSPRTNWTSLASFELDLPPRDFQERLAQVLRSTGMFFEEQYQAHSRVSDLRIALINERYRRGHGTSALKDTPLGPRPSHWVVAPLKDHYDVQLGKMMSPQAVKGASHRPYLRNANVQWNRLDLTDVATMSFTEREVEKFNLVSGDILACEGRHVGKSAIWRGEIPGACYQKALHRIRAKDSEQVPEFLLYQMDHHSRAGLFTEAIGETTIPHLPAERLREIYFSFPPKVEQLTISKEIQSLDSIVAELSSASNASWQLLMEFCNVSFEKSF